MSAVQLAGGVAGAVVANLMFALPTVELSTKTLSSGGIWLAEVVCHVRAATGHLRRRAVRQVTKCG